MRAICSSIDRRGAPGAVAAADVARGSWSAPAGRTACEPPRGGTGCRTSARSATRTRPPATPSRTASALNPGGGANTVSRCDIQQVCSLGVPASSRPPRRRSAASGRTRRPRRPPPGRRARARAAASRSRCPAPGSPSSSSAAPAAARRRRIPRPARRTGSRPWGAPGDLGRPDVVGQQLGEHAALAHAPRDQLRVLAAVVEDHHLVGGGADLLEAIVGRGLGRTADSSEPECRRGRRRANRRHPRPRRGRRHPCRRPARAAVACPRSAAPERPSARRG